MERDITGEQLRALRFRRERLEDRLRRLEGLVSGRQRSFLPLVRDSQGRFSEERAQALVGQLLEARDLSLRLSGEEGRVSGPEDRTLFRSFLYCAIRCAESPPSWDPDFCVLPDVQGNYEDFVRLAESLAPVEKADLIFREFYQPMLLEGFFAGMDEMYSQLAPAAITESVSEADYRLMRQVYEKELRAIEQEWKEHEEACRDFRKSGGEEAWRREVEERYEQEEVCPEALWEEDLRQQEARRVWRKAFPEKEQFCRQYLLFRRAYFDAPVRRIFSRDVRDMLETALLCRGASRYLDDEEFFSALTVLEKAGELLRRQLWEGR